MAERTVRQARADDAADVRAFTAETWSDRDVGDYIPDAFAEWVETDGPSQRTAVAEIDGQVVGICQASMLTCEEAWLQGMRVDPAHRGGDHGVAIAEHLLSWCRERNATVARNMVFGWNAAGMGQSRAVGFEPATACRWARPEPEAGATAGTEASVESVEGTAGAWRYWTHSDAREALDGLALDSEETWALAELDRDRLASAERVFAVVADRARGMTARLGTREREGETVADYAVGAWDGAATARALFAAIRSDAAACGADATRVPIPDTPRAVSDAALARAAPSDTAVFVFAADLTGRPGGR